MKTLISLLALLLGALLAAPAAAQPQDWTGDWHGALSLPGGQSLRLVVTISPGEGGALRGELADRFDVSRPTMSAHFNVLREAGLIDATRQGKSIIYRLRMSVLEEALMGLAQTVGLEHAASPARGKLKEEEL